MIAVHRPLGTLVFAALLAVAGADAQADDFRLLTHDGHAIKWGAPALGTPAIVTYALATRDMHFPTARNCQNLTPVQGFVEKTGLTTEQFRESVRQAAGTWARVANIRFREIADPDKANVVFGGMAEDNGVAFTDVSYDEPARAGSTPLPLQRSTVCLNSFKTWRLENDGNDQTYTLTYVLAHEIGHTIGLDHPGIRGALMGFAYRDAPTQLGASDVNGVQRLYGPAPAGR